MPRIFRSLILAVALVLAALPAARADFSFSVYSPDALAAARETGQPFLIDFFAPWCTTCRAQERAMARLYQGDSKYNAIPIIRVDWDTYRDSELVASMNIPRRSTLVLIEGDSELGRIVADPREASIQALLDLAF